MSGPAMRHHCCGARSEKRIEHDITGLREQFDEPFGQRLGKYGAVTFVAALGCENAEHCLDTPADGRPSWKYSCRRPRRRRMDRAAGPSCSMCAVACWPNH